MNLKPELVGRKVIVRGEGTCVLLGYSRDGLTAYVRKEYAGSSKIAVPASAVLKRVREEGVASSLAHAT